MSIRALMLPAVTGAVLIATNAPAHTIIMEPNGGEVFTAGEVVTIRWCIGISHDLQNWDLRYHTALPGVDAACGNVTGGFDVIELDVAPTCTEGGGGLCAPGPCCMEYAWTIPDGINSDQVKIKVKMDNAATDYYDLTDGPFTIMSSTSSPIPSAAAEFRLQQNEPNPLRSGTSIAFSLESDSPWLRLFIHDARGALVRELVNGPQSLGRHSIAWDATNEDGLPVSAGIYFYRLEDRGHSDTRRMVLLR